MSNMQKIGTLVRLRRYPVKSMAGEDLSEVFVAFSGLIGDRVYAWVDESKKGSFPWLTARQKYEMLLFTPRFVEPPMPEDQHPSINLYKITVKTPEGKTYDIEDPAFTALLAERFGKPIHLRFSEKGMHDSRPISLFSMETLAALEQELTMPLDPLRFRANFYVTWDNKKSFFEDELIGKTLKIGDTAEIALVKKDPRCVIITLDPATAESDQKILAEIAREHENCVGVYAAILREGIVKSGDPIFLKN